MQTEFELRKDFDDVSDEEWEEISKPFYSELDSWLHQYDYLIDEFVALYISAGINYNSIWSGSFSGLVNGAIETLGEHFNNSNLNEKNFNKILAEKYGLKMVSKNPMKFIATKKSQD